jgi:hypothetical protein
MSSVQISGNASGTGVLTIASPNTNSSYTATLPAATTTLVGTDATQTLTNKTITGAVMTSMASSVITSGTALAYNWNGVSTNTYLDFTSIPSWVKRITVMFNGVTLSSSANLLIQVGSGSVQSTGYISTGVNYSSSTNGSSSNSTSGFLIRGGGSTDTVSGHMVLTNFSSNTWIESHSGKISTTFGVWGGGNVALSGALDRVRITSTSTDTFTAGSINILYE